MYGIKFACVLTCPCPEKDGTDVISRCKYMIANNRVVSIGIVIDDTFFLVTVSLKGLSLKQ